MHNEITAYGSIMGNQVGIDLSTWMMNGAKLSQPTSKDNPDRLASKYKFGNGALHLQI